MSTQRQLWFAIGLCTVGAGLLWAIFRVALSDSRHGEVKDDSKIEVRLRQPIEAKTEHHKKNQPISKRADTGQVAKSNEPKRIDPNDLGRRTVISGTIITFYLGDDAVEYLKEVSGEEANVKPALQLRTTQDLKIQCLFGDNQEDKLKGLFPGDRITVEGDFQLYGGIVGVMRNCRLVFR